MTIPSVGEGVEQLELLTQLMGVTSGTATLEDNLVVFIKLHIHLPYGLLILLLDIYPREIKACPHNDLYRNIADLFGIPQTRNRPVIHLEQARLIHPHSPTVPLGKEEKEAPTRWLRTHLSPGGHGS